MELLLLPTVTEGTFLKAFAAFFVAGDEGTRLPIFTELCIISEEVRFTPEILEVVRVNALCLVMFVIVRAPFSFEVEDVEVIILVGRQQLVYESDLDILH